MAEPTTNEFIINNSMFMTYYKQWLIFDLVCNNVELQVKEKMCCVSNYFTSGSFLWILKQG